MFIYEIYHIPEERKIGVSVRLVERSRVMGRVDERYTKPMKILERVARELDDEESWQIAGDRERHWQDQYGYPRDRIHYKDSRVHLKLNHVGTSGLVWVTDGKKNRMVLPSDDAPEGYRFGNSGAGTRGKVWVTDGVSECYLEPNEVVPEGFYLGRNSSCRETRYWCTDGEKERRISFGELVPDGWRSGRKMDSG
jgi:hypothetical protein